jgi:hypothetical protein
MNGIKNERKEMNQEPSVREMVALWNKCLEFVDTQDIWVPETIYQTDRVVENSQTFIEDVCNIVGYKE